MRIKKNNHFALWCLAGVLLLMPACKKEDQQKKASSEPKILAEVNGSIITADDLDLYIESSVGRETSDKMDGTARKKALEGLVLSRIMAQSMEKKLDAKEKTALERKVAAYREQQLVKKYIMDEIPPSPVTKEMIEEYYRGNPEKFGAMNLRKYEILGSEISSMGNDKSSVLDSLTALSKEQDWKKAAASQQGKTLKLNYADGWSNSAGIDPNIANLVSSLESGKASGVTFINSKPCVVRVIEEKKTQAKPLGSVEESIRKSLLATQVSNAVKSAKEDLLKKAQVKYMESSP